MRRFLHRCLGAALVCGVMSQTGCDLPAGESKSTRAEGFSLRGHLEAPASNAHVPWPLEVQGWALDDLTEVILADVVIDDHLYFTTTQGGPSPELCSRFPGRLHCNRARFHAVIDQPRLGPGAHKIVLRLRNTRGGIRNVVYRTFFIDE